MPDFKPNQYQIKSEPLGEAGQPRVFKLDEDVVPRVANFEFSKIQEAGDGSYQAVKARYGALAATDPDRHTKDRKSSRFTFNPLIKEPLSIEEEERREIDRKVKIQLEEMARV